jgi:hypothetical protein
VTSHVTALLPPVAGLANIAAAVSDAEAFTASDVGGGETKVTPVGPGGGGGDWLCEPPQPASAKIASKPTHPATIVGSSALGRLMSRSFFCLIHSIRHSVNNAG